MSDAMRECRIKKCLPVDIIGNLISPVESLNQQYFNQSNHAQSGHVSDDVIKSIPLEFAFLPIAVDGFFKRSVPLYTGNSPALERVNPVLNTDLNDKAKRYTASAINIFQTNANCSEVIK